MRRLAFLGNGFHIYGVMKAALAEGHLAVAALEADVLLAQVLIGERHPHPQGLSGRHSIGIDVKCKSNVDMAPVTHAIGVGRCVHRLQVIPATREETLVVVGSVLGSKFLAQQPQVAHTLAEPHLLAIDVHHFQRTGVLPVLDLGIGGLGHLLTDLFDTLLGGDAEIGADALHDGAQRVDAHGIGHTHLLGQGLHHLLGTGKLTLGDQLIHLGLPVGSGGKACQCQKADSQCQQTFFTFHSTYNFGLTSKVTANI